MHGNNLKPQSNIALLEQARWKKTARLLREKLFIFADRKEFSGESYRAQSMFFDNLNYDFMECDDDFIYERFLEWFLIDYVMACGGTLTEIFMRRNDHQLSAMEILLLCDWKKARISLYEIEYVDCKGYIIVEDLLRGSSCRLRTNKNTGRLEKGDVVLLRLMKTGNHYEFSTNGIVLPLHIKPHIVKLVEKDFFCLKSVTRNKRYSWDDYLKEKAHVINNLVAELGWAANTPNLLTVDGHEFAESRAIYEITGYTDFLQIIDRTPYFMAFKEPKEGRRNEGIVYNWIDSDFYKYISSRDDRLFLGKLVLIGDKAELRCISQERLEKGKSVMDSLFQGLVKHKKDCCVNTKFKMLKTTIDNLNLSMLESEEKNRLPESDGEKVLKGFVDRVNEYNWESCKYIDAATQAIRELTTLGYRDRQMDFVLFLWHEYCKKKQPVIRKPAVWAAVLVYTIARLEFDSNVRQKYLAEKFGVSPSTISLNFRSLCQTLELNSFDRFLLTERTATAEMKHLKELLFDIFGDFRG